jgi:hypothetical protein
MNNNGGTIDLDGFREDLRAIDQNTYPQLRLIKLPMSLGAGIIYQVPLPVNGNNLVLTYEALDENGIYQVSVPAPGSITAGATPLLAQGFARINQTGPWIPLSMFSPLMQGLATAAANYSGNPIIGAGYSSLQTPIHQLEWQVNAAFQQAGFMLAFFGMNYGLRGGIGNGSGGTYAIPSAAGPVAREIAARCKC